MIRLIDEQGKLTPELETEITQSVKMQQVEDLYRPYKQKRRTKATIAKEKGLEPLALWLMQLTDGEVQSEAEKYIDKEKEISSAEEALQGAHEIIAEQVSDNAKFRTWIRSYTYNKGMYVSQVKDEQADKKAYTKCIMTLQNLSIKWFLIGYWPLIEEKKKRFSKYSFK